MYFLTTGNVLGRSEGQQRVQYSWSTVHPGKQGRKWNNENQMTWGLNPNPWERAWIHSLCDTRHWMMENRRGMIWSASEEFLLPVEKRLSKLHEWKQGDHLRGRGRNAGEKWWRPGLGCWQWRRREVDIKVSFGGWGRLAEGLGMGCRRTEKSKIVEKWKNGKIIHLNSTSIVNIIC